MNSTRRSPAPRRTHPAPTPNTPVSAGPEKIDPRWAWHHRTLLEVRERLLRAHQDHASQAATPPELRGIDVDEGPRDELDRDVLWAELGHEDDRLFEIDSALSRIHDGTYGFCELTGQAIPEERLRAIPWTRYSVAAAKASEKPSPMKSGL
jgi:RNA polymerase-binding transcription factor DksA